MLTDLFSLIDFDTRGEIFSHFSQHEFFIFLEDYYIRNIKLSQLIKIYNLNTTASKIRKHFPKIVLESQCEKCHYKKSLDLPIKSEFNVFCENICSADVLEDKVFKCYKCGHNQENIDCLCQYCRLEKTKLIIQSCTLSSPLELKRFGLKERLYLAVILQGLNLTNSEDYITCSRTIFPKLFFNETFIEEITHLYENHILVISPDSPIESFVPPSETGIFPSKFYIEKVYYSLYNLELLMGNELGWFQELKFPTTICYSVEEKKEIWEYIAISELLKLFDYQLKYNNFKYASLDFLKHQQIDAIKNELKSLLISYSPSQIYEIIWRGIRQSISRREQLKAQHQKIHHADNDVQFVISYGIRSILKYNKGISLKGYDNPATENLSLITKVFFEQILKRPNWFYEKLPEKSVMIKDILSILSDEEKKELINHLNVESDYNS